jgi:hypothetical protein
MWRELAVKLSAFASSLGGPLYVFDLLAPRVGSKPQAFAIVFLPVALLIVGALSLGLERERLERFLVRAGRVGAWLLLLVDAFASWQLFVVGVPYPNRSLVAFGILVGVLGSAAYLGHTSRSLRPRSPNRLVR